MNIIYSGSLSPSSTDLFKQTSKPHSAITATTTTTTDMTGRQVKNHNHGNASIGENYNITDDSVGIVFDGWQTEEMDEEDEDEDNDIMATAAALAYESDSSDDYDSDDYGNDDDDDVLNQNNLNNDNFDSNKNNSDANNNKDDERLLMRQFDDIQSFHHKSLHVSLRSASEQSFYYYRCHEESSCGSSNSSSANERDYESESSCTSAGDSSDNSPLRQLQYDKQQQQQKQNQPQYENNLKSKPVLKHTISSGSTTNSIKKVRFIAQASIIGISELDVSEIPNQKTLHELCLERKNLRASKENDTYSMFDSDPEFLDLELLTKKCTKLNENMANLKL